MVYEGAGWTSSQNRIIQILLLSIISSRVCMYTVFFFIKSETLSGVMTNATPAVAQHVGRLNFTSLVMLSVGNWSNFELGTIYGELTMFYTTCGV